LDAFRLGVQKCRKTIQCTVGKDFDFFSEGTDDLFRHLRNSSEKSDGEKDVRQMLKLYDEKEDAKVER
jgi:hypothetical protein